MSTARFPQQGVYGDLLLNSVRRYFDKKTFYQNDASFRLIASDFFKVLHGKSDSPKIMLASWQDAHLVRVCERQGRSRGWA